MRRLSTNQITAMVISGFAALAIVLAPAAVQAAGSLVTLTDSADNARQARVSTLGELRAAARPVNSYRADMASTANTRYALLASVTAPTRLAVSSLAVAPTGPAGGALVGDIVIADRLPNYRGNCSEFAASNGTAGGYSQRSLLRVVAPFNQTTVLAPAAALSSNILGETGQPSCYLFRAISTANAPTNAVWNVAVTLGAASLGNS